MDERIKKMCKVCIIKKNKIMSFMGNGWNWRSLGNESEKQVLHVFSTCRI